jgi:hypothetical protein
MNTNVLFPFLAFMTEDFGYTGHRLGIYAGMMAATFSGAQFFSCMLWGAFSDRYGRKAAVIFGVIGAGLGMGVFGSAQTYTQAIIGRAISGFLSGNLGIIKSFLTEITDSTNRPKAFSMWSLASICGNIVGPLMGGFLCKPVEKYPMYFDSDGIFAKYPYFLPCLVVMILDLFTGFFCLFVMKETRKEIVKDNSITSNNSSIPKIDTKLTDDSTKSKQKNGSNAVNPSPVAVQDIDDLETEIYNDEDVADTMVEMVDISKRKSWKNRIKARLTARSGRDRGEYESVSASDMTDGDEFSVENDEKNIDGEANVMDVSNGDDGASVIGDKGKEEVSGEKKNVLRETEVLMATGGYGLLAMTFILLDESVPLLLKQNIDEGGFSFTSSDIGTALALGGGILLIFSTFFLSKLAKGSKIQLFKIYNIAVLPFVFGFPLLALLNKEYIRYMDPRWSNKVLWALLIFVYSIRNVCATLSFTGVNIIIYIIYHFLS